MAGVGADYEQIMVPAVFRAWAPVLADFVKVVAGERALDVACGTGVVARELIGRVGAKGTVVGCDSNAAMLATAREMAPQIDWREGNALDLPFESASFDVVTCQQGYQFFPDRESSTGGSSRPGKRWPNSDCRLVFPFREPWASCHNVGCRRICGFRRSRDCGLLLWARRKDRASGVSFGGRVSGGAVGNRDASCTVPQFQ